MEKNSILFITTTYIFKEELIGIKNKIMAQKQAMEKIGLKVDLITINEPYTVFFNDQPLHYFRNHFLFSFYFFQRLIKQLSAKKYQYIYIRNPLVFDQFGFIKFLKKNITSDIILELPTYPYKKERTSFYQKVVLISEQIASKYYKKYIKLILYSGNKVDSIHGINAIQVKHGSGLDKYRLSNSVKSNKNINLIAVASFAKWHGLERILEGVKDYINNPFKDYQIKLFLIGNTEPLFSKYKKFIEDNNLEDYIEMTGSLHGKDLDAIFDQSHIGIGSLGMHRIGLQEGSPLKTAEYAVRGLPFIVGYKDSNFYDKTYCLQFSGDESPINIKEIIKWYNSLKIEKNDMRIFTLKNFSWDIQLKELLNL